MEAIKNNQLVRFISKDPILFVMTLAVSLCTSSFAFDYGSQFDTRLGVVFAAALFALTFHFSKMIPPWALKLMRGVALVGLCFLTVFVSAAAWLTKSVPDDQVVAQLQKMEAMTAQQVSSKGQLVNTMKETNNPINMKYASKDKDAYHDQSMAVSSELLAALKDKQGRVESFQEGPMMIFGYVSNATGYDVKSTTLVLTSAVLLVLICTELTMGAALHAKPSKTKGGTVQKKGTVQSEPSNNGVFTRTDKKKTKPKKPSQRGKKKQEMIAALKNKKVDEPLTYTKLIKQVGGSRTDAFMAFKDSEKAGTIKKVGKVRRYAA